MFDLSPGTITTGPGNSMQLSFEHCLIFYHSEVLLRILLSQFQQLTSLTLRGMPPTPESQERLWWMINSMPYLRRLHLLNMHGVTIPAQLPVLSQLEQFTLTEYEDRDIVPVLSQLGPACKTLLLDYVDCNQEKLQKVLEFSPHLYRSMKSLFLGNMFVPKVIITRPVRFIEEMLFPMPLAEPANPTDNSVQILQFASANFESLQHLDVSFMLAASKEAVSNLC